MAAGLVILARAGRRRARHRRRVAGSSSGSSAAFLAAGAALVLVGTDFPPLGIALDQGFRAASVTKYAHTLDLVDFAYTRPPRLLPAAVLLGARAGAAWLDVDPYEALKVGVLVSAVAAPARARSRSGAGHPRLGCSRSPSRSARSRSRTGTSRTRGSPSSCSCRGGCCCVLQVGRAIDRHVARCRGRGALIGAAVVLHLLLLLLHRRGAPAARLLACRRPAARARAWCSGPARPRDDRRRARRRRARSAPSTGSRCWSSIVTTPGARSMQNRYSTRRRSTPAAVPRVRPRRLAHARSASGTSRSRMFRSELALALATLLAAAYAWFLLGDVGMLVDVPLLNVKTTLLIDVVLLAGTRARRRRRRARGRRARARSPTGSAPAALRAPSSSAAAVRRVFALGTEAMAADPVRRRAARRDRARRLAVHVRPGDTRRRRRHRRAHRPRAAAGVPAGLRVQRVERALRHPAAQFDGAPRFLDRLAREQDPDGVRGGARAQPLRQRRLGRARDRGRHASPTRSSTTRSRAACRRRTFRFEAEQFDSRWFRRGRRRSRSTCSCHAAIPHATLDADQRANPAPARSAGDLEGAIRPASR